MTLLCHCQVCSCGVGSKANQCIASFGHRPSDVRARFDPWGGVVRAVLEQTSEYKQEVLEEAIKSCTVSELSGVLRNLDSAGDDNRLTHLVHMPAKWDYTKGAECFASAFVKRDVWKGSWTPDIGPGGKSWQDWAI